MSHIDKVALDADGGEGGILGRLERVLGEASARGNVDLARSKIKFRDIFSHKVDSSTTSILGVWRSLTPRMNYITTQGATTHTILSICPPSYSFYGWLRMAL